MRKYQFMLVLLLAGTTAFSQNIATDTSAQVIAWWRKGEVKNLVISKTTEKKDNGKVVQRTSGSYGATITVIDSTAEGYTLQWQYHYKAAAGQPELQVYEKMLDELKVIYKTSDVGDFEEVVNFNEMRLFIDKTIGELKKSIRDTAALNAIMPQVQQIFSSRESVEQLVLRDISLYHSLYGAEYTAAGQQVETTIPNFLGGEPFPAILSARLKKVDARQDRAYVAVNLEIDKNKAAEYINDFIRKAAAQSGKEIPPGEMPSYIEIKDRSEYEIMLSTGWIKKTSYVRVARSGALSKTETVIIELK